MINEFVGERLKALRFKKGIKQTELAKMLGVSQGQVARYESYQNKPPYAMIKLMAEILGTTPEYLMGEKIKPKLAIVNEKITDKNTVFPIEMDTRKIPVFTAAGAGGGKVTNEDVVEMVDSKIGDFGVIIRGDSMSPVVEDGDVVIIEKFYSFDELERGQMVIVRVNGDEAVLKYLTVDEETGHVVLRSENFDYPPKFLPLHRFKGGDCEVIGKVVEIRSRTIPRG